MFNQLPSDSSSNFQCPINEGSITGSELCKESNPVPVIVRFVPPVEVPLVGEMLYDRPLLSLLSPMPSPAYSVKWGMDVKKGDRSRTAMMTTGVRRLSMPTAWVSSN